ncbi:hypothetical protein SELMODRAFT_412185 [Selaginella moellendorffii]|uniref:HIT-type domain-containing protein n=1 Tax=Selaginella moellendorffii TaxID=88036 RepID=D8RKC2_SELML|nr:box C/D snoRNA protein 1 isoform X2 [Selaginella moellendorffii]EFJ27415.1 hypothetical protein SELMODRAFT_412185 [Selaginella moellendorffii]|eukprot:XP_002971666.1 box C/D snoRNA protein 1 isoform X2 [Selaginella moellendorffii]
MSGKCDECGQSAAKYKCPGCGLRSCGLPCVKAHKARIGCTGKRDPTAFVKISDFDDNRIMSDYNFLEEALRVADVAKRSKYKSFVGGRKPGVLKELIYQARFRKTKFVHMANGMSRRIANTTYFNRKRKCMYWRVEWIFHSTDIRLVDENLDEHVNLGTVLEKHLSPQSHSPTARHQLREFLQQPVDQLKLLFKKELDDAKESYYELNINESLRQQLSFKTVLEFPEIRVVLPSDIDRFSMVEEEPKPVKLAVSPVKSVAEELVEQTGKTFREEEIKDEEQDKEQDDMKMYDFLGDLPGQADLLWKSMEVQPPSLMNDVEDGELSG